MELRFRTKLSENLGEICHMVSRNELFCQNFCRNSSREHCGLNWASLEELNSWKIHENHPGNIHHLTESTQKFQVINFPIFSRAKKIFLFVTSSSISTAIQQLSPSCPGLPRTIFSQVENGAPGSSSWAPLFWKHQTVRGILRISTFHVWKLPWKWTLFY